MAGAHARLSASAAHRWLQCAGSVNASQGLDSTSAYAAAGTFAHHIAAECLPTGGKVKPEQWLGNKTIVDGHEVECTQEMVDAIHVYIDAIADKALGFPNCWVEMPLLNALQQVDPDFGGTADFVAYNPLARKLVVVDFKYGSGTFVDADDNEQMKIYALGAMVSCGKPILDVEVCIVQPRHEGAAPVRSYNFKAVDILEFMADLQEAAEKTRLSSPPLRSGDWCKFCPAARTCPELERKHHELVAAEFSPAVAYDPAKLAAALVAVPLVKERIKAIEEFAYAEATRGATIPGFKLVEKRANRSWKNEAEVIEWATSVAIDPFVPPPPPMLLSPAKIQEKLEQAAPRGKKKEAGKVLAKFTQQISSGTALVPESDERPPAQRISIEDFTVVQEGT